LFFVLPKGMALEDQKKLEEVVRLCVKGDRKAQKELYKKFYSKMMGVCYRYTNNGEDAKDLLQDGVTKVFINLKRYQFNGSLEGWIRRIIVNTAIDHFRKKKNVFFVDDEEDYLLERSVPESADAIYSQFGVEEIMSAVQSLSPAYRTVFNLYALEGFPHKEIAEKLCISEGTSKSNLAKAKKNLQNILLKKENIYRSDRF